jgi:hypothetical protein
MRPAGLQSFSTSLKMLPELCDFVPCPLSQFQTLKKPLSVLYIRNFLKKCALHLQIHTPGLTTFQQFATSGPQLFQGILLRNCTSTLPQSTAKMHYTKVVELRLASSKMDFQTTAMLGQIHIWIHWDQELFVELGSDPNIILEADVDTK